MLSDPKPLKPQPRPDESLADEDYTTATREGADVPDLQPLLNDLTDQEKEEAPDEQAGLGHS
ncbi:MAG: hypothetical protein LH606_04075 [Cytophagaceae bacterium]|nr:hypothetical protein [Cytophagaceae bacterium]